MLIGHRMYGQCTMLLTKVWLFLVSKYVRFVARKLNKCFLGRYTHLFHVRSTTVSMTSGLVQDIEHQVLPSISPTMTFILTIIFMIVIIRYLD
jgi:hypothetical protein